MPLFALANAGIHLDGDLLLARRRRSPVTLGIIAAYVVGKPLGHPGRGVARRRASVGGARLTDHVAGARRAAPRRRASASRSRCWSPRSPSTGRLLDEAKIGVLATALALAARWPGSAFQVDAARCRPRCARASSARPPRRSSTSPRTSTPSATTSAAASTRRSRCSSTATSSARTAATRRRSIAQAARRTSATSCATCFRHLPLTDVHPNAQLAAEAAEAAAAQGSVLGDARPAARPPGRARAARPLPPRVGARPRPRALLRGPAPPPPRGARRRGRRRAPTPAASPGTPTFFINGRRHQGVYDVDTLTAP